jgi:hypothetical protein
MGQNALPESVAIYSRLQALKPDFVSAHQPGSGRGGSRETRVEILGSLQGRALSSPHSLGCKEVVVDPGEFSPGTLGPLQGLVQPGTVHQGTEVSPKVEKARMGHGFSGRLPRLCGGVEMVSGCATITVQPGPVALGDSLQAGRGQSETEERQ